MLGNVEVEDAAAIVSEHDEDEEDAQGRGRNGEEIEGDQIRDVIGKERAPGLRGRCAALRDEPGDGALGHVEAELQQLPMDSRSAPERIGRGHSCDKGRDLRVDRRAASGGPTGEFGPVLTQTAPLPPQNGGGSHDDKGPPPSGPHLGQPDPEEPIAPLKLRPLRCPLVDGQLLTQREVLQSKLTVATEEEGEEPKQMEQESDHRTEIVVGSEPTDQPPVRLAEFWRGTARMVDVGGAD